VDAVVTHPDLAEVISPELVLIDPELAEIARRRLREYQPPPVPPPRVVVPAVATPPTAEPRPALPVAEPPRRERRRPTRALGAFVTHGIPTLVVAAVLLAMVASEIRVQLADGASNTEPAESMPTRGEVEIRALATLNEGTELRVPSTLLDERTGLLLDNVHVSCRRVEGTALFGCTVGAGPSGTSEWWLTVVTSRDDDWSWQGLVPASP
jgi:hypothetical protein